MPANNDQHVITVTQYVVPLCLACGRYDRKNDLPDVCEGMDEFDIKAELYLEEDDDIPQEFSCFRCSNDLDIEGGFWTEVLSAEDAFGLGEKPDGSPGRRASNKLRNHLRKANCCTCAVCGESLAWNDCTLDHITARCKGGPTDSDNLIVFCSKCNQLKGSHKWPIRIVVSPVMLFPDKELSNLSPEEERAALDYFCALFDCLDREVPLKDQQAEIAKQLRAKRRNA